MKDLYQPTPAWERLLLCTAGCRVTHVAAATGTDIFFIDLDHFVERLVPAYTGLGTSSLMYYNCSEPFMSAKCIARDTNMDVVPVCGRA